MQATVAELQAQMHITVSYQYATLCVFSATQIHQHMKFNRTIEIKSKVVRPGMQELDVMCVSGSGCGKV